MSEATVSVLGSGVNLGVYIPAMLVARRLEALGVAAEVEVIESCYQATERAKLWQHKKAYHKNFSLALMAHRMVKDIRPSLDPRLLEKLLARWQAEDRRRFLVWSGFWLPILDAYRERRDGIACDIHLCRIDAVVSASFQPYADLEPELLQSGREVWLWPWHERRLDFEIPVGDQPPLPWDQREARFVIHGGGWGLGNYQRLIPELRAAGFDLDILAYELEETHDVADGSRCFMVRPGWAAWQLEIGERAEFPPFGPVRDGKGGFRNRDSHHELFDTVRRSRAVISKPGGGTMIDSLASATPLILLDPFGYAEEKNADIWEHLGFGIRYEAWRATGFDLAVLERLHRNLLEREPGTDYPRYVAQRVHER